MSDGHFCHIPYTRYCPFIALYLLPKTTSTKNTLNIILLNLLFFKQGYLYSKIVWFFQQLCARRVGYAPIYPFCPLVLCGPFQLTMTYRHVLQILTKSGRFFKTVLCKNIYYCLWECQWIWTSCLVDFVSFFKLGTRKGT